MSAEIGETVRVMLVTEMKLRDYFAGLAMGQLISLEAATEQQQYALISAASYAIADDMLRHRERRHS